MKAKRRQELKTNDLAQTLQDLREGFRQWGVYVVGVVALIVVITAINAYRVQAEDDAMKRNYASLREAMNVDLRGASVSDEQVRDSLATIGTLAADTGSESFKLEALLQKGALALAMAQDAAKDVRLEFVDIARSTFEQILSQHGDNTLYCGRALCGLFQVEACAFVVDDDSACRDRAKGYLDRLQSESRFNGTVYQMMAVDMLNRLDEVFTTVILTKRPEEPPAAPTALQAKPAMTVTPVSKDDTAEPLGASQKPIEKEGEPADDTDQ